MKATLSSLVGLGLAASANAWLQVPSGTASFTYYSGCGQAGMVFGSSVRRLLMLDDSACGKTANGFTAAISQLTFGSSPGLGAGDVCGRCFSITGKADPYSPSFSGPFKTIIVKATDMCPVNGNSEFCGQTSSNPTNTHGASVQ